MRLIIPRADAIDRSLARVRGQACADACETLEDAADVAAIERARAQHRVKTDLMSAAKWRRIDIRDGLVAGRP